jgi:hypothetical protein
MPPAESRKSQTIRHATRPYSVQAGAAGVSRIVVRDVLLGVGDRARSGRVGAWSRPSLRPRRHSTRLVSHTQKEKRCR